MWIEVSQDRDELGEPEQWTWDLFPPVESACTLHLDANGLPKVGTFIYPGMIIVGKIGKTKKFDPKAGPSSLEIQGGDLAELRKKYGGMWKDASFYATPTMTGIVRQAWVEETPSGLRAVVEIEPTPLLPEMADMTSATVPAGEPAVGA